MPKYSIGDTVWLAKCQHEQIKVQCPTCFGKLKVTLILGNGEHVILPCEGCEIGYDGPKGYVTEYDYVVEPEFVHISGIEIQVNADGEKARYRNGPYVYDETDLFSTKEEAFFRGKEQKRQLDEIQRKRADWLKKDVHKNFSWNANYHMRQAKEHLRQAEYHKEKAQLCKERVKGKLPSAKADGFQPSYEKKHIS